MMSELEYKQFIKNQNDLIERAYKYSDLRIETFHEDLNSYRPLRDYCTDHDFENNQITVSITEYTGWGGVDSHMFIIPLEEFLLDKESFKQVYETKKLKWKQQEEDKKLQQEKDAREKRKKEYQKLKEEFEK